MANALREKIAGGGLVTAMAAHNPLSARLAEEAGFDGIWASGFELSAAYGVPDASLLSLTQHLDMTRAIIEQVGIPLIADLGIDEALRRGAAYAEAGADLLLIHSKQKTPDEIVAFTGRWPGTIPLVIVPTAYPDLTEAKVRALGKIAIVIYANHAVRAAVTAMREVFAAIRRDGGIHQVESRIASVDDIFNLQRVAAMKAAEKKYLR